MACVVFAPSAAADLTEIHDYIAIDNRAAALGRYLLFYRAIEGGIEVVRVLHGMRDIERIFGEGERA